jgi:hypothetical protein
MAGELQHRFITAAHAAIPRTATAQKWNSAPPPSNVYNSPPTLSLVALHAAFRLQTTGTDCQT